MIIKPEGKANNMILADTSVLIDYLKGLRNKKTECFDKLILENIPFGINKYIYQEILQGARDEKEFELLKDFLSTQRFFDVSDSKESYEKAAMLYLRCRKKGVTIRSTIGAIIAQCAIENRLRLLHNDKDFTQMASVIEELMEY